MFLTLNYFGTVANRDFLAYQVLGTPFCRMFSFFGSPLTAGAYFSTIVILIWLLCDVKCIQTKVLLGLNLICLVLTFSRTGLIATIIYFSIDYMNAKNVSPIKKITLISIVLVLFFSIAVFLNGKGFYFWNFSDWTNDPRVSKYYSALLEIPKNWLLGTDFEISVSSHGTFETTLSDNSILIFLSDFGLLIPSMIYLITARKTIKKLITNHTALLVFLIIVCFFYDYIQVFPANYIAIMILVYCINCSKASNKQNKGA